MNSRRKFIRNTVLAGAALSVTRGFGFNIVGDATDPLPEDRIIGHNGFTYKFDKDWAKISVNTTPLFNCHEMVEDSKGRLIMIGDNVKNNILIFDKSGKLLDSWGSALPGGHGLSIAKEGGEDFLLMTDCGYYQDRTGKWNAQSGQVLKTTTEGKLIFAIGHPRTIGVYRSDQKFQPTETAVAPNGDIYVADGYGSDYIIHYDSNGKYIRHFGGHDNASKDQNLHNAHGVTVDTRDKNNPTLICSSREENCFKVFTMEGKFLKRIDLPGMYPCRAVIDDKNIYAGVCWSKDTSGKQLNNSGFVTVLDNQNKIISNPGGTAPVYKNGIAEPTFRDPNPVFCHGHDVCVDEDKNLYVCQWNANYTPPVKLTRVA